MVGFVQICRSAPREGTHSTPEGSAPRRSLGKHPLLKLSTLTVWFACSLPT